jgi:rubrerythrin
MIEKPTVHRAVEFAITTEQLGQKFYQRLAETYGGNDELPDLFGKLARDEELHASQLRSMRDQLPGGGTQQLSERDAEYLQAISTAEIFYGNNDPLAAADAVSGRDDALQLAHNLEKSTLLYYHAMREVIGPTPVLDAIIDMERRHLTQVIKYMVTGAQMRGLADDWT